MPVYVSPIHEWLSTPAGVSFVNAEKQATATELGRLFGAQFLQIGLWGDPDAFLHVPGTARRALCDPEDGEGVDFIARPERLPVTGHSVDALLLPHTLELTRYPHEVLRESERVLTAGGRIILLGFNPFSVIGLRRLVSRGGYPPGLGQMVTERRLRDWLRLLGFDVTLSRRYFTGLSSGGSVSERLRRLPQAYGAYMVIAIKRLYAVTPTRLRWRNPAKVPVGLIEPSTRNSS